MPDNRIYANNTSISFGLGNVSLGSGKGPPPLAVVRTFINVFFKDRLIVLKLGRRTTYARVKAQMWGR